MGPPPLRAATHIWNLSPSCVRVTEAKCPCPDPILVSLPCPPLSPVSVSPVCMSPCLALTSRSHNLIRGRTCPAQRRSPVLFGSQPVSVPSCGRPQGGNSGTARLAGAAEGRGLPTGRVLGQSPPRRGRTTRLTSVLANHEGLRELEKSGTSRARPPVRFARLPRRKHREADRLLDPEILRNIRGAAPGRLVSHPRRSPSGPGSPSAGSRSSSREASGAADPGDVAGLALPAGPGLPGPNLAPQTLDPDPDPFTPPLTLDPELQSTWSTL